MKKIISLFQRNYETDKLVRDEVVPGAEWVLAGEGIATVKIDGTCCKIEDGLLYKRYDAKHGKQPPPGFHAAQEPDPITGHWPGWVLVDQQKPEDKWHREAFTNVHALYPSRISLEQMTGTYELVGPKINGNPYRLENHHMLIEHGCQKIKDMELSFEGIKAYLALHVIEGIVWHHPDGRMVKIKRRDFGFDWPVK